MYSFFLDTPLITGLVLFVLMVVVFAVSVYLISHRLFKSYLTKEHEKAGRVLFRTSASLLALILSFTFANERIVYYQIKDSLISEATHLVDIYVDLNAYGGQNAEAIKDLLVDYLDSVLEEGWIPDSESLFDTKTTETYRQIYYSLQELEPKSQQQEYLKSAMLEDADLLSNYMQVRIYQTRQSIPQVFITSAGGLFITMILFAVYRPDRITIFFLALYSGFIGTIIYFLIVMSQPLQGPMQIRAEPFFILKEAAELRE